MSSRPARRLLEAAAVTVVAAVLTGFSYRSVLRSLSSSTPFGSADSLYFAWQLSWIGHALGTHPGSLLSPPVYSAQQPGNLAFTDMVFGYAPLSWLLGSGHAAAFRVLNLALLIAVGTSFLGAYALARVLGAAGVGALVAGAGFAFAPWRLAHVGHINVMSTGVGVLALAALCRGHGWSLAEGWRPERVCPGWILAGWLLAVWQLTFGFAVGVVFGWVLAAVIGSWVLGWARDTWRSPGPPRLTGPLLRRVALAEVAGGLAFALAALVLTWPYLWVVRHFPEARRDDQWAYFSPWLRSLLTAPGTSLWWGTRQAGWRTGLIIPLEMTLLPGFVLLGVAVLGLACSSWPVRRRFVLLLVVVAVAGLSLGGRLPVFGSLFYQPLHALPGMNAIRTPGRLISWATLGLCLLAAGALTRLRELSVRVLRGDARTAELTVTTPVRVTALTAAVALVLCVPAGAVTLEGRGRTPMPPVTFPALQLTSLPQPVLVLPFEIGRDYQVMAWQTDGWPVLANGNSSFDPKAQAGLRRATATFPSPAALSAARARGIATVVLVPQWAGGTAWQDAAARPFADLGIGRRQIDGLLIFDTR